MKKIETLILIAPYARPGKVYAKSVSAWLNSEKSRFVIVRPEGSKSYGIYDRKSGSPVSSLLPPKMVKRDMIGLFVTRVELMLDVSIFDDLPQITPETDERPAPDARMQENLRKLRVDIIDQIWPLFL